VILSAPPSGEPGQGAGGAPGPYSLLQLAGVPLYSRPWMEAGFWSS